MKRTQGEEVEVEIVETSKKVLVSRDDMQKMNPSGFSLVDICLIKSSIHNM